MRKPNGGSGSKRRGRIECRHPSSRTGAWWIPVGGALVASLMLARPVAAQNPQARAPRGAPGDTTELVFEREVFTYPGFERRNPFRALVGGADGGPRFEQLQLLGIIQSPQPDLSVALLGVAGASGSLGETYRVRQGQTLGNTRILDIQRSRVIVQVTEFGLTEQRVLELQRPDDGGGS